MDLELETFTPAETEAITDVKQTTIRNWRRAKHFPQQEGHARYTLLNILYMSAMGMMVSRGISPGAAKEFAYPTARAIFQSALWSRKTFADDVLTKARDEAGEITSEQAARFRENLGDTFRVEMLETVRMGRSQEILVKAAERHAGMSGMKHPNWLIIWADGSIEFYYDDEDPDEGFFGNIETDGAHVQGPVMMFCLAALAQMVIDRLPRPAIRLHKEAD